MKWKIALAVALLAPAPALAWGDQGHSLTCQIAYDLMTPVTRQTVDGLLARQAPKYRNLPNACTYPDDVNDQDGRRSQHFVNLRRSDEALADLTCPVAGSPTDCLLAAIKQDYDLLRTPSSSDDARSLALMYLGHWLGDLHQPLHISFKDDTGGNSIETTGYCGPSKLHSVWDTCIIVQRIYATVPGVAMIDDPRFIAKAKELADAISLSDKGAWTIGEPWQWANESYAIARKRAVKYCTPHSGTCWYDDTHRTYEGGQKRRVPIDAGYLDNFAPTVTSRLQMGGVRLAYLLNRAFDPAPMPEVP